VHDPIKCDFWMSIIDYVLHAHHTHLDGQRDSNLPIFEARVPRLMVVDNARAYPRVVKCDICHCEQPHNGMSVGVGYNSSCGIDTTDINTGISVARMGCNSGWQRCGGPYSCH
jgi:hypothetical protein